MAGDYLKDLPRAFLRAFLRDGWCASDLLRWQACY
jgi:hypothetical protein